jgi:hypothetical protein
MSLWPPVHFYFLTNATFFFSFLSVYNFEQMDSSCFVSSAFFLEMSGFL